MNVGQIEEKLQDTECKEFPFGVALKEVLIGTVSLIRYEETVFGLGYWIGEKYSGSGYMTEAVRAVIDLASKRMGATELWAGIKPNNDASIALVERLDFRLAREQITHHSYRLQV